MPVHIHDALASVSRFVHAIFTGESYCVSRSSGSRLAAVPVDHFLVGMGCIGVARDRWSSGRSPHLADKGTPVARPVRKAQGLSETARLPYRGATGASAGTVVSPE